MKHDSNIQKRKYTIVFIISTLLLLGLGLSILHKPYFKHTTYEILKSTDTIEVETEEGMFDLKFLVYHQEILCLTRFSTPMESSYRIKLIQTGLEISLPPPKSLVA